MTTGAQVVNVKSRLLSDEDNEAIFRILGRKCRTLCTTVGKLNREKYGSTEKTVIICLVKDFLKRSYFLRVYDRKDKTMLWEQDIRLKNSRLEFRTTLDGLLTISKHNDTLKFSDGKEADMFKTAVEENLAKRRIRRVVINKLDPVMKALFERIGIEDQTQVDEDTMNFIYNFIEKNGGLDAVRKDLAKRQPSVAPKQPAVIKHCHVAPPPPPPSLRRDVSTQTTRSIGASHPLPGKLVRFGPPTPPLKSRHGTGSQPPPPRKRDITVHAIPLHGRRDRLGSTSPPPLPPRDEDKGVSLPGKMERKGPSPLSGAFQKTGTLSSTSGGRDRAEPPPLPQKRNDSTVPPPLPPHRSFPLRVEKNLLGGKQKTGTPPSMSYGKDRADPPPLPQGRNDRTVPPHPPPHRSFPLRVEKGAIPLPSLPGEVKDGGPLLHLQGEMERKGPSPLPGRIQDTGTPPSELLQVSSKKDGDSLFVVAISPQLLSSNGNHRQGSTENPLKQQIMQLFLQNPGEMIDLIYDVIEKRGRLQEFKIETAGQSSQTDPVQGNGDEVPGRRGPDTGHLNKYDELVSDFLDDDGEWDD